MSSYLKHGLPDEIKMFECIGNTHWIFHLILRFLMLCICLWRPCIPEKNKSVKIYLIIIFLISLVKNCVSYILKYLTIHTLNTIEHSNMKWTFFYNGKWYKCIIFRSKMYFIVLNLLAVISIKMSIKYNFEILVKILVKIAWYSCTGTCIQNVQTCTKASIITNNFVN